MPPNPLVWLVPPYSKFASCAYGVTNSSATTIDLVLSPSSKLTKTCETVPPIGISDHNGILFSISMQIHQAEPQAPRRIWRYNYADFDRANELLSLVNASSIIVDGDVEASWSNWESVFWYPTAHCLREGISHGWPSQSYNLREGETCTSENQKLFPTTYRNTGRLAIKWPLSSEVLGISILSN